MSAFPALDPSPVFGGDNACSSAGVAEEQRVSATGVFVPEKWNNASDEEILSHQLLYPVKACAPFFVDPIDAEQR